MILTTLSSFVQKLTIFWMNKMTQWSSSNCQNNMTLRIMLFKMLLFYEMSSKKKFKAQFKLKSNFYPSFKKDRKRKKRKTGSQREKSVTKIRSLRIHKICNQNKFLILEILFLILAQWWNLKCIDTVKIQMILRQISKNFQRNTSNLITIKNK